MSLTGRSTLSLKKKDVQQQKKAGTAYRRLVFAHKASAGETGINFTSLTQPSEMAALGFTNPSSSDILAANILFYKKNLTVISSARGVLMQDLSYIVPTSSRIEFQGFVALQDEIFTCLLETGVKDGLNVVDASPIIATGELAIGSTDFNVGTPFEVGKYSSQQIGSVLVFRNGAIQFRNPSNTTSGGNYQEVDNGSGLGTIIRFNNAPVGQTDNIVVWGNLLAERPDGSMMAAIESLAGQLDQMIPTLAALAGVPETTFQGQPNNQDLKAFGDKVSNLENIFSQEVESRKTVFLKDVKANGVSGDAVSTSYVDIVLNTVEGDNSIVSLSSNQFTLQAGTYYIRGFVPAISNTTAGLKNHKAKLFNITDSVDVIIGTSSMTSDAGADVETTESFIVGTFTLTSQKTFSIRHRASNANMSRGVAASFGDSEVYSTFEITKIEKKTIAEWLGV